MTCPYGTTIDIPEPLHDLLRHQAERTGSSIRSLIIGALEQVNREPGKGKRLTGLLVHGSGKLGRAFPEDENPRDLVFPDLNVWPR